MTTSTITRNGGYPVPGGLVMPDLPPITSPDGMAATYSGLLTATGSVNDGSVQWRGQARLTHRVSSRPTAASKQITRVGFALPAGTERARSSALERSP